MEKITPILEIITFSLNMFCVAVLIWGCGVAAVHFFVLRFLRVKGDSQRRLTQIKNSLGSYVLLSLEILIAADIIESIMKPDIRDIVKLAAIVVIRTVISYFLNKEIKEYSQEEKAKQDKKIE